MQITEVEGNILLNNWENVQLTKNLVIFRRRGRPSLGLLQKDVYLSVKCVCSNEMNKN